MSNGKEIIKEDQSQTNPGLHSLYTGWAIQHLLYIDKCIKGLHNFSNTNIFPVIDALVKERDILVKNNKAYEDADKLLKCIKEYITIYQEDV